MQSNARTRAERTVLALLASGEAMSWDDLVSRAEMGPERAGDAVESLLAQGVIRVIRRAAPPAAFALSHTGLASSRRRARRSEGGGAP